MRQEPLPGSSHFLENRRRADSWNNVPIQLVADIIPQCADAPVQHLRPTGPLPPVRRCQALNLPWPTFVRGRKGGSAWTGGLRFGRRGYSEHRMLLVAGLSPYCTASRQLHILPLLTRGIASQHSFQRPVLNHSRPDGSSVLACRMVPWHLSHLDAGTRFIVSDSIRNLGQEERAVVTAHRNAGTNDFT